MAHLRLYRQATPGETDGIEVTTAEEILAEYLDNSNGAKGVQWRMLCVRCDAGYRVPTLTITTSPAMRIRVSTNMGTDWNYIKALHEVCGDGSYLYSIYSGGSWSHFGASESATLYNIRQTNMPFALMVDGRIGESGDYTGGKINFSFVEEVI